MAMGFASADAGLQNESRRTGKAFPEASMKAYVLFLRQPGDQPPATIKLAQSKVLVGRAPTCGIVLPDVSVSRRHAELVVDGELVTIRDLNSRNGTYVDENRIYVSNVSVGQCLRFGGVPFQLAIEADKNAELETQSVSEALESVATAIRGLPLSAAERRVFDLILSGLTEKEIAGRLKLSHHTVHNHIRQIYRIAGVRSRVELLAQYVQLANVGSSL
jgi:pSer/pThr/pTyr-binding forkhead associated (FHA) protein